MAEGIKNQLDKEAQMAKDREIEEMDVWTGKKYWSKLVLIGEEEYMVKDTGEVLTEAELTQEKVREIKGCGYCGSTEPLVDDPNGWPYCPGCKAV